MNAYKLELAIERALKLTGGNENLLNLSDADMIELYKHTRLDNTTFCDFASKLCRRSPNSLRAFLILKHVYRLQKLDIQN